MTYYVYPVREDWRSCKYFQALDYKQYDFPRFNLSEEKKTLFMLESQIFTSIKDSLTKTIYATTSLAEKKTVSAILPREAFPSCSYIIIIRKILYRLCFGR